MKKRLIVALIGGALLGVVCVVGAYLRSGFTASPGFVFSLWYNRVIIGLAVGAPGAKSGFLLVGTMLVLLIVVLATRKPEPDVPAAAAAAVFPAIYLGVPLALTAVIRDQWGREALLLGLVVVWISDTAQFYVGSALGRHRLAPLVSPKKSVEGAVGGFVAGIAAMALIGRYWLPLVSLPVLAAAGAVLVALGIAGDLFESLLKRSVKVKDSSALIPGHGGVLDRIDSLCFSAPLFFHLTRFFFT